MGLLTRISAMLLAVPASTAESDRASWSHARSVVVKTISYIPSTESQRVVDVTINSAVNAHMVLDTCAPTLSNRG